MYFDKPGVESPQEFEWNASLTVFDALKLLRESLVVSGGNLHRRNADRTKGPIVSTIELGGNYIFHGFKANEGKESSLSFHGFVLLLFFYLSSNLPFGLSLSLTHTMIISFVIV